MRNSISSVTDSEDIDEPEDFVEIELDEDDPSRGNAMHASVTELGSLRTSYRRGPRWWKSQLAVDLVQEPDAVVEPCTPRVQSSVPPRPSPRRHSIASSSPGSTAIRAKNLPISDTAAFDCEAMPPPAVPDSSTPVRRRAEGRYRSRLEQPHPMPGYSRMSSSFDQASIPNGVRFDPAIEPGVSITVADETGELYVVRSPRPCSSPSPREMSDHHSFALHVNEALMRVKGSPPPRGEASLQRSTSMPVGCDVSLRELSLSKDVNRTEQERSFSNPAKGPLQANGDPRAKHWRKRVPSPLGPRRGSSTEKHADEPHETPQIETVAQATSAEPPSNKQTGPSNLTRMTHLPPKSRKEEARHLADFTAMMQQSKEKERIRIQKQEAERVQKEQIALETRQVWNEEILPCWTRAKHEPKYRTLWWQGIPQTLRARLWPRAVGNNLMLPHDLFQRACKEAANAKKQNAIPASLCQKIDQEIAETLPSLGLFHCEGAPLHEDLKNVLYAYVTLRADEACQRLNEGTMDMAALDELFLLYVPGSACLAAMLLLNLPAPQAFLALLNLIASNTWLRSIYHLDRHQAKNPDVSEGGQPAAKQLQGFERVFNTLLADKMPNVYANLHKTGIRASDYLRPWIRTLFVPWLDIDTASRVWDILLLDNGVNIYRVALAIVQLLEPRLYDHDQRELLSILRGNNPGALSVWRRSSARRMEEEQPKDRIYSQYCIDETSLFNMLQSQESWWRDSTLKRLLDRELS
ncbi:hypothetical protein MPSI1_002740 [Malassezia psittaci]|uniref:Rab-GAP TBC domain-containing protein n=1 Tax=Malassezia psittaci TaxID=1821823 RepID=A0AAF0FAX0_9BASI|nr:hypothetical protein MPSI1_002740 [Malassezia psittaci]